MSDKTRKPPGKHLLLYKKKKNTTALYSSGSFLWTFIQLLCTFYVVETVHLIRCWSNIRRCFQELVNPRLTEIWSCLVLNKTEGRECLSQPHRIYKSFHCEGNSLCSNPTQHWGLQHVWENTHLDLDTLCFSFFLVWVNFLCSIFTSSLSLWVHKEGFRNSTTKKKGSFSSYLRIKGFTCPFNSHSGIKEKVLLSAFS